MTNRYRVSAVSNDFKYEDNMLQHVPVTIIHGNRREIDEHTLLHYCPHFHALHPIIGTDDIKAYYAESLTSEEVEEVLQSGLLEGFNDVKVKEAGFMNEQSNTTYVSVGSEITATRGDGYLKPGKKLSFPVSIHYSVAGPMRELLEKEEENVLKRLPDTTLYAVTGHMFDDEAYFYYDSFHNRQQRYVTEGTIRKYCPNYDRLSDGQRIIVDTYLFDHFTREEVDEMLKKNSLVDVKNLQINEIKPLVVPEREDGIIQLTEGNMYAVNGIPVPPGSLGSQYGRIRTNAKEYGLSFELVFSMLNESYFRKMALG